MIGLSFQVKSPYFQYGEHQENAGGMQRGLCPLAKKMRCHTLAQILRTAAGVRSTVYLDPILKKDIREDQISLPGTVCRISILP